MSFWKWSRTAANHATADGSINWAEGQAPSTVNDSARAMMAAAANDRFKTSVRLQRSLAIVAAFMFLPNCRRWSVSFSQHPFAIEDDVTVCQVRVRRLQQRVEEVIE